MIITLIFIGVLLFGVTCAFISKVAYKKYCKYDRLCDDLSLDNGAREETLKKRHFYDKLSDVFTSPFDDTPIGISSGLCVIAGSAALVFIIPMLLVFNSSRYIERNKEQMLMERDVLEYRLETEQEKGNELLYNDILEFNQKIYRLDYDSKNPWISWFNPKELADIEMIDYKEGIND